MKQISRIAVTNPHKQFNNSQKARIKRLKEIEALQKHGGTVSSADLLEIESHLKLSGIIDKKGNLSANYKVK